MPPKMSAQPVWERLEQFERRRLGRRAAAVSPGDLPEPSQPPGTDLLPQIKHIVVLMMENHSPCQRWRAGHLQWNSGDMDGFAVASRAVLPAAEPFHLLDYPPAGTIFDLLTRHGIAWANYHPAGSVGSPLRCALRHRHQQFYRRLGTPVRGLRRAGQEIEKQLTFTADLYPPGFTRCMLHVRSLDEFFTGDDNGTLPGFSIVEPRRYRRSVPSISPRRPRSSRRHRCPSPALPGARGRAARGRYGRIRFGRAAARKGKA